jgi:hypothetical protein
MTLTFAELRKQLDDAEKALAAASESEQKPRRTQNSQTHAARPRAFAGQAKSAIAYQLTSTSALWQSSMAIVRLPDKSGLSR